MTRLPRHRRIRRRFSADPPAPRFGSGVEFMLHGTELHLASLRFVDTLFQLSGVDHPAFATLKAKGADLLGKPPRLTEVSSRCSKLAIDQDRGLVPSKVCPNASLPSFAGNFLICTSSPAHGYDMCVPAFSPFIWAGNVLGATPKCLLSRARDSTRWSPCSVRLAQLKPHGCSQAGFDQVHTRQKT